MTEGVRTWTVVGTVVTGGTPVTGPVIPVRLAVLPVNGIVPVIGTTAFTGGAPLIGVVIVGTGVGVGLGKVGGSCRTVLGTVGCGVVVVVPATATIPC